MWKIAKNEFRYQLNVIYTNKIYYIVVGLILFPNILSMWSKEISHNLLVLLIPTLMLFLFYFQPAIYCVSLIHQSIYELTGKRLRVHSSKPLEIRAVGKARLLYPLLNWLAFALIYFILGIIANESVKWLDRIGADTTDYYIIDEVNFDRALQVSMIFLYLTYASKTLFERGSRIIGIAFLGFLLFWFTALENSVPDKVSDLIKWWIDSTVNPEIAILLSLIFASLTYYSFTRRRSFLA